MPVLDLELHLGRFVGMLFTIGADPGGKATDGVLDVLGRGVEILPVERVVVEEAHQVVVLECPLPLHLGHPSGGLADGQVDVFETVLGLGIPQRVVAGCLGVGVDMGHAPAVAVERRLTAAGWRCQEGGERPGEALADPLYER